MKYRYFLIFAASMLASIFIFSACSEEDIVNALTEKTCALVATPTVTLVESQVTYSAKKTGTASITNIVYWDAEGNEQRVDLPDLPWSLTITMPAGQKVGITAAGITLNGSVEIKYSGSGSGVTFSGQDSCSQSGS